MESRSKSKPTTKDKTSTNNNQNNFNNIWSNTMIGGPTSDINNNNDDNNNSSSFLPSSSLSLDYQSVAESYEELDSLSDISTEKSDGGGEESNRNKDGNKKKQSKGQSSSSAIDRQNENTEAVTVDQKTRSKNREHAKKTRIRKKNYIESLRETVKRYSEDNDRIERNSRITLSRLVEQTRVRKQVLQTMFYFRAIAETSVSKWSTILDENFVFVMPITPYRSFPPSQVMNGQRLVRGVDGMIKDTASLSVLVQSIGQAKDDGLQVRIQYYSELDDGIMSGNSFMCRWLMKTENVVERGARQEVYKHGMVEAVFTPQNKLIKLEMTFDVMSFMQQLRRASGRYEFHVVPNTVSQAISDDNSDARLIVEAVEPFPITSVNQSWCSLLNYKSSDVVGKNFNVFRGAETEEHLFTELVRCFGAGEAKAVRITGYTSDGARTRLFLKAFPLYSGSVVTHFLCIFESAFDFLSAPSDSTINVAGNPGHTLPYPSDILTNSSAIRTDSEGKMTSSRPSASSNTQSISDINATSSNPNKNHFSNLKSAGGPDHSQIQQYTKSTTSKHVSSVSDSLSGSDNCTDNANSHPSDSLIQRAKGNGNIVISDTKNLSSNHARNDSSQLFPCNQDTLSQHFFNHKSDSLPPHSLSSKRGRDERMQQVEKKSNSTSSLSSDQNIFGLTIDEMTNKLKFGGGDDSTVNLDVFNTGFDSDLFPPQQQSSSQQQIPQMGAATSSFVYNSMAIQQQISDAHSSMHKQHLHLQAKMDQSTSKPSQYASSGLSVSPDLKDNMENMTGQGQGHSQGNMQGYGGSVTSQSQEQQGELAMNAASVIYGVLGEVSTFDWTDFLEEDNCYNVTNASVSGSMRESVREAPITNFNTSNSSSSSTFNNGADWTTSKSAAAVPCSQNVLMIPKVEPKVTSNSSDN